MIAFLLFLLHVIHDAQRQLVSFRLSSYLLLELDVTVILMLVMVYIIRKDFFRQRVRSLQIEKLCYLTEEAVPGMMSESIFDYKILSSCKEVA